MTPDDHTDRVQLRAFMERDLPFLDRLCTDPDALGEFEWPGFADPRARRKRWETDGYISADSAAVAIVGTDGTVVGIATWRPRGFPSGVTHEIGVGVVPEHRGKGVGTAAQKLLVDYLWDHTTANRIEALTNGGNLAEQKALERLGFRREGVMRGRSFQHGRYVDVLVYGLLRSEHRPETTGS
ncbi:GNAT family N-acetyltransferase [Streptomyces sp. CA-111067]|uniref:GNAT family N-acetyltransferase n=1 Tax=Streptomyces sp. CA-111067 TaxID=3240046 RepID=UPI003D97A3A2